MSRTLRLLFSMALLLLVGSCKTQLGGEKCTDNGDCEGIAVCTEAGRCEDVDCLNSSECELGSYCDPTAHQCMTGCSGDDDCLAGESCNTSSHTCQAYGCRDTQLDCMFGEYCNEGTGQCEQANEPHCQAYSDYFNAASGCTDTHGGQFYCDGEVTYDSWGIPSCSGPWYCVLSCDPTDADACPRGFECGQMFVEDTSPFCAADCAQVTQYMD